MTGSILERINEICQQLPDHVRLIAISKGVSLPAMREAYAAGVRDFGENRLQEALPKIEAMQDLADISWHFIGHLQTNKAKKAVESFQWIHSVDSLKLANHLNYLASELMYPPQIFLQVKVLPDPHKYGWDICELLADLPQLNQLEHLKIKGLMTILPKGLSESENSSAFATIRQLFGKIQQQNWSNLQMEHLSMGMSSDYLLAIKSGSTMIRLGRIIFS